MDQTSINGPPLIFDKCHGLALTFVSIQHVDKTHREKYNIVVQELFNPRFNWSNLRARIQGADTPMITPFNLVLHDLAMMNEHDTYQDQQEKYVCTFVGDLMIISLLIIFGTDQLRKNEIVDRNFKEL